jgi:hypothetical protein
MYFAVGCHIKDPLPYTLLDMKGVNACSSGEKVNKRIHETRFIVCNFRKLMDVRKVVGALLCNIVYLVR